MTRTFKHKEVDVRSKFDETKVKMVMKLKKLTHRAAVEEIARMDAAKRKVAEEEAAREAAHRARMEEKREALLRRHSQSANISRGDRDGLMTAKEFFGEN